MEEGSQWIVGPWVLIGGRGPSMAASVPWDEKESVMGVGKKAKREAKAVKGKSKKGAGKVKSKGKKAKKTAKH
jgi:hypothetical protein